MQMKKYKLGELMEVTRGTSLGGEFYSTQGELMRLTLGNFDYKNNCFKDDKSKDNLFFTGIVKPEFILKKDDIITPLTEQAIGLLGSTAKIPCDGKYIQSQDVALIKCNEKLNPNFAFYLIPSKLVRNQLSAAAQQTKIRHTSPDKIKDCTVWIPEYSSQEKIGNFLSLLDKKIALNSRINAKLEQMAKRLYDYWFVQFDFPRSVSGEPGVHELSRTDDGKPRSDFPNENGKPYKSSGGKMVYSAELKRGIPAGWGVKKLGDLVSFKNGINYDKNELGDKDYKIVNVRNISSSSLILSESELDKITLKSNVADNYLLSEKSILVARSGCPGETRLLLGNTENIIFCGFIICLEPINDILKCYLTFSLKKLEKTNATKTGGSILQNVSQETLKRIDIIIPPENLIISFNEKINPILLKYSKLQEENAKLTALRDKLLPLLMNGQVEII